MKFPILLIGFILIPLASYSQGFFISKYYSPKEYKSYQQIWEIKQDSNQYLYFGTGGGLVQFNGVEWEGLHIGDRGRGTAFHDSQDGKFYTSGQYDFGFLEPDSNNQFKYASLAQRFYENKDSIQQHMTILEKDNEIFFYGYNGLEVLQDKKLDFYPVENINSSIAFFHDNRTFIASGDGLYEFNNGKTHFLEESKKFNTDKLSFAIKSFNGNMLLGYVEGGFFEFDGYTFRKLEVEKEDKILSDYIYKAVLIDNNLIAIATLEGGVYFLNSTGEIVKKFDETNGLFSNSVLDLYIDHEKTLWLGLWGGIQKIPMHNSFNKFMIEDGVGTEVLEVSGNGDVIVARTINNVYLGTINEDTKTFKFDLVRSDQYTSNFKKIYTRENKILFQTEKEIYEIDTKNKVLKNSDYPLYLTPIKDYDDNSEDMWLGNEGVFKGNKLIVEVNSNIPYIKTAIRFSGDYFFSNNQRIYKLEQDSLVEINILGIDNFSSITNADVMNNQLFIAIEGEGDATGIYNWNHEKDSFEESVFFKDLDSDLTSKQVLTFTQCLNGDIWIFNDFKIKRVFRKNDKWLIDKKSYNTISEGDAIFTIECINNTIWLGGTNGVYQVQDLNKEHDLQFKTHITKVFIKRDSLIYGGYGNQISTKIIPYKDNELRFSFAATSYIDPERNTYSYRLDGFDEQWSNWTSETQKDYTNIPEGNYTFIVRSRNVYEYEGIQDAFTFTILPPWYRTWWAYTSYLILILSIVYFGYRIRLNQILKVQGVRNRIADDLHDDLSGTLIGISNFAKAISTNTDKKVKDRFLGLIQKSADEAKEKISDIVWTINPEHDEWLNFMAKCRRHASDIFESQNIDYSLEMDESIAGQLNMELRKNLWLIFKEILTNIIKHSKADYVLVRFKFDHKRLRISIKDNGKGFDLDQQKKGNGINSINKRVETLDGTVELISGLDEGTSWEIQIDI